MDYVEGRGVTSGNEVYFIFDADNDVVVMATYRDAPGVRSDLLKPNIVKTFSKDEWGDINEFLAAGASENEEEEEVESSPLFQQIAPETSEGEEEEVATPPKVAGSIPSMTANDAPEEESNLMDVEEESGKTDE